MGYPLVTWSKRKTQRSLRPHTMRQHAGAWARENCEPNVDIHRTWKHCESIRTNHKNHKSIQNIRLIRNMRRSHKTQNHKTHKKHKTHRKNKLRLRTIRLMRSACAHVQDLRSFSLSHCRAATEDTQVHKYIRSATFKSNQTFKEHQYNQEDSLNTSTFVGSFLRSFVASPLALLQVWWITTVSNSDHKTQRS
jgi:hypothetical protein